MRKQDLLLVCVFNSSQALSLWLHPFFWGQIILHALWHFFISSAQTAFRVSLRSAHACVKVS